MPGAASRAQAFGPEWLARRIEGSASAFVVAWSGGADSTALLAALWLRSLERFQIGFLSIIQPRNTALTGYVVVNKIVCIRYHIAIFINYRCCYKRKVFTISMNGISICFQDNFGRRTSRFYFLC